MNRQDIADRLYRSAKEYAQGRGYEFGHDADGEIGQMSGHAADQILARSPTDSNLVKEGEAAFRRLVDEMIKSPHARPKISQNQNGVIGEKTLQDARTALCPLWPIC